MTTETPNLKLVYPTGADLVQGGDDMIRGLALALDSGMIPYRMAAGSKLISASGVSIVSTGVTFAVGRFTFPPLVITSLGNAPGGSNKAVPRATSITASGFSISVYSGDNTAVTFSSLQVNWIAVQMLTDKSNGGDA